MDFPFRTKNVNVSFDFTGKKFLLFFASKSRNRIFLDAHRKHLIQFPISQFGTWSCDANNFPRESLASYVEGPLPGHLQEQNWTEYYASTLFKSLGQRFDKFRVTKNWAKKNETKNKYTQNQKASQKPENTGYFFKTWSKKV